MSGRALLMQPGERDEHARALLLRQRLAVVPHPEAHMRAVRRAAQLETRWRAAVLEGVAQQVQPHLPDPGRIAERGRPGLGQLHGRLRARLQVGELAQGLPDQATHVERLRLHALLRHRRQQQQSIDHLAGHGQRAERLLHQMPLLVGQVVGFELVQDLEEAIGRSQRRLQAVGDGVPVGLQLGVLQRQVLALGEQLLLQPVQLQMMLDARQQLLALDRFGDVVDRAEAEALDLVGGIVHRGHEDDRDVGGARIALEPAADFEAVHLRHAHVEQDEVRRCQAHFLECLRSAAGQHQVEPVLGEKVGDQAQVLRFVVDDQQRGAARLTR